MRLRTWERVAIFVVTMILVAALVRFAYVFGLLVQFA